MRLASALSATLLALFATSGMAFAQDGLTPEADAATVEERLDQLDELYVTNRRESAGEPEALSQDLEAILEEAEQAEKRERSSEQPAEQ